MIEIFKMFRKKIDKSTEDREQGKMCTDTDKLIPAKILNVDSLPAGIIAYMGDSIFELVVRNFFIQRGMRDSHKLHRQVIKYVNAGAQANFIRSIEDKLTEEERTVLRRARNANCGNVPRHAKVSDYRYSTGLEAVLGYLMLKGRYLRLEELITLIEQYLQEQNSGV